MNFSPNTHKIIVGVFTLLVAAVELFGKHAGIADELRVSLVTFLTLAAGIVQGGAGTTPPGDKGMITRIVGGISAKAIVLVAAMTLVAGCSSGAQKNVTSALDLIDAIDTQAANILGFIAPNMPEGDAKVAALKAARAAKDFAAFFGLAKPIAEQIAAGGEGMPRDVAAQLATGAAAAKGIEQGMRALSGRNPADGSPKTE